MVQLTLGDLTFAGQEIPERLPFGVEQALTVHKLVGGERVVDAMGRDDHPLEWSGWFMGPAALERALYLHTQCTLGQGLILTMSQLRYLVVIQSFEPNFENVARIPYRISCTVVEDQNNPVTTAPVADIDDQMDADMLAANGYGDVVGDGPLSGLLSTLGGAISAVSTFAHAGQAAINSVLLPLAAVRTRVGILIASSVNSTENIATLGGVLPNTPISQNVAQLGVQAAAFEQQPALYGLDNVTGRMEVNMRNVAGNSTTINTAGGNLFDIAASQYGDASSWTGIAKANGLTDPQLVGLQRIVVPTRPDNQGGVLGL